MPSVYAMNWESLIASKQRAIATCVEPDPVKRCLKANQRRWYKLNKDKPEYKERHLRNVYAYRKAHEKEYKEYRREYMREWRKNHKENVEKHRARNKAYRERLKAKKAT